MKLAQPRSQREGGGAYNEGGTGGGRVNQFNNSNYQGTGNYPAAAAGAPTAATGLAGGASFDPQVLASLYTRMITQMNPMMNPMVAARTGVAGSGYGGPMVGGMGMPGFANPLGGAAAVMGNPGMSGMGRPGMMHMNPNIPRGPRGGQGGPGGPGAGVGPQRAGQRGTHSYHPYAR